VTPHLDTHVKRRYNSPLLFFTNLWNCELRNKQQRCNFVHEQISTLLTICSCIPDPPPTDHMGESITVLFHVLLFVKFLMCYHVSLLRDKSTLGLRWRAPRHSQ